MTLISRGSPDPRSTAAVRRLCITRWGGSNSEITPGDNNRVLSVNADDEDHNLISIARFDQLEQPVDYGICGTMRLERRAHHAVTGVFIARIGQ